ncbi:MAG: hypothetical protein E7077_08285 [Bacteroidales bacterium]|jgi:hypothetical protein|nr:hypothetical protein [Bacteroidales bacterium]
MSRTKDSGNRDNGQYVDGSFVLSYDVFEPRNSISKKAQRRLYDYCKDNHFDYAREFYSQSSSELANHSLS